MRTLRNLAMASLGVAALALVGTGSTMAAFSEHMTIDRNQLGAATVVIGGPEDAAPSLSFQGLQPGEPIAQALRVRYAGTIPADIFLEAITRSSPLCQAEGGPRPGGAVEIRVAGSGWSTYCSSSGATQLVLKRDAAPGEEFVVQVESRLAPGTDGRYSQLATFDPLAVHAVQSGGGFSDYATGSTRLSTATIGPAIPASCSVRGRTYQEVVVLHEDQRRWDAVQARGHGAGPFVVIGTDGADTITGSVKDDCLVGGDGDDVLDGGNGEDILLGDAGNDRLQGGNGKDNLDGGPGDDYLEGGGGKDDLFVGPGTDTCVTGTGASAEASLVGCETAVKPRSAATAEAESASQRQHALLSERVLGREQDEAQERVRGYVPAVATPVRSSPAVPSPAVTEPAGGTTWEQTDIPDP